MIKIPKSWSKEYKNDLLEALSSEYVEEAKSEVVDYKIIPIKDTMKEAIFQLEHPDLLDGISTGYRKLDKIIGGLAKEELIVIGGGTGQGKSLFSQAIALNVALSGKRVLMFVLEMPPRDNTIRFMSMRKSENIEINNDSLAELPIDYFYGDKVNLKLLDKVVEKAVENGTELVIIDHLHFFARAVDNQSAEIGNITREIKMIARRHKVPIILISHIRKMNNIMADPQLDDLRDSSFIAQDSDLVIMIWRNMENPNSEEFNILKAFVRKNRRRGQLGELQYHCDNYLYLREDEYVHNRRI